MTVRITTSVQKMISAQASDIVEKVVETMKNEAPVDSGHMRDHIYATQVSTYSWIVSTHSTRPATRTSPAFEYPAHIELGEEVVPTKAKALYYHNSWHKRSAPSKSQGFAARTVSKFK